jgi:hypothetical protein
MPSLAKIVPIAGALGFAAIAPAVAAQDRAHIQPAAMIIAGRAAPVAYWFIPPYPDSADSAVAPAMPADPAYHGPAYAGALTVPSLAQGYWAYPPCTARLRDRCTNTWRGTDQARPHRGERPAVQPN